MSRPADRAYLMLSEWPSRTPARWRLSPDIEIAIRTYAQSLTWLSDNAGPESAFTGDRPIEALFGWPVVVDRDLPPNSILLDPA